MWPSQNPMYGQMRLHRTIHLFTIPLMRRINSLETVIWMPVCALGSMNFERNKDSSAHKILMIENSLFHHIFCWLSIWTPRLDMSAQAHIHKLPPWIAYNLLQVICVQLFRFNPICSIPTIYAAILSKKSIFGQQHQYVGRPSILWERSWLILIAFLVISMWVVWIQSASRLQIHSVTHSLLCLPSPLFSLARLLDSLFVYALTVFMVLHAACIGIHCIAIWHITITIMTAPAGMLAKSRLIVVWLPLRHTGEREKKTYVDELVSLEWFIFIRKSLAVLSNTRTRLISNDMRLFERTQSEYYYMHTISRPFVDAPTRTGARTAPCNIESFEYTHAQMAKTTLILFCWCLIYCIFRKNLFVIIGSPVLTNFSSCAKKNIMLFVVVVSRYSCCFVIQIFSCLIWTYFEIAHLDI